MNRMQRKSSIHVIVGAVLCMLLSSCTTTERSNFSAAPPHAVVGVSDAQLDADFWIRRAPNASRTVLDARTVAEQNARLLKLDPSARDMEALPPTLSAQQVRTWIESLSNTPQRDMFDASGRRLERADYDALIDSIALEHIPATQNTRLGLVVRRADLRTFPSMLSGFTSAESQNVDRFQETALFPGTPVAMVHESRDGKWWFVVSSLYTAWVEKRFVAAGSAQQVFGYTRKSPYLVVTGATARTVFTPTRPSVSELQLDMGVRVPVLADWLPSEAVNGQHPYTAHVIELPERAADGSLAFTPALLPRTADTADDYLPLTRANLLDQGFKFLGERYGWGHSNNARDCSGFVSEVYRSFGVQLPRNTRDQSVSPALNRITFTDADDHERRMAVLRELHVGDLIYIPGHVMMVIGFDQDMPYVIHDTTGISYLDEKGDIRRVTLNGVSVTPITPLLIDRKPMVDRITSILRVRS